VVTSTGHECVPEREVRTYRLTQTRWLLYRRVAFFKGRRPCYPIATLHQN
jgi:hypothetical protein